MKRFLFIITFIIFILCTIKIILYVKDNINTKRIESITSKYVYPINKNEYFVNFDYLKTINKDIVGYLIINGIDLKYPVVKTNNNNYYLNHNFNNEYSGSGWIFMDYRNKLDLSDKNIIIYGHNMKDNTMFGLLDKILSSSFKNNQDNLIITLIREDGIHKYQIFSVYTINNEDYYTTTIFKNDLDYKLFLDVIKYRSKYDYNVDVDTLSNIITLSTCYKDTTKRLVVHAKEFDF